MKTWSERAGNGQPELEVVLKERTLGTIPLSVELHQTYTNLASSTSLNGLVPLGVSKISGHITVAADAGVGIKTSAIAGVAEVPLAAVPGTNQFAPGTLAFKRLAPAEAPGQGWQISLATDRLEAWIRAEVAHVITLGETRVSGRSVVRYEIQNAPVKEFRFKAPASWRNLEILGAGIRRKDLTDGVWRVELQNKVVGEYRLQVQWDTPRDASMEQPLGGLETLGVERETGFIALIAASQLQLTLPNLPDQWSRIDSRELPDWITPLLGNTPALAYRYGSPRWNVRVSVHHYENAATLQALVDNLSLRTVLSDDGQQMTQLELGMRNNGRQNLSVTLPPGAIVWSAFVDGRPVRPARQGNVLLLKLEGASQNDAPVPVELTFVGTITFPKSRGTVTLESPRIDLPIKDARWELFLPPDYSYSRFQGTMTYESAELLPLSQDFTIAEYQRQEISKQASFTAQAVDFLRRSKSEVATGNLANAGKLRDFRNNKLLNNDRAGEELRELEREVNRAQSSQLIEAQRAYALRYGLEIRDPASRVAVGQSPAQVEYDAKVAEQQVAQLNKAQAVGERVVAPLRANLPTRGLRYSFAQVLQTKPNEPMIIRLTARNDEASDWWLRGALAAGTALSLWIGSVIVLAYRRRARPHAPSSKSEPEPKAAAAPVPPAL